MYYIIGFIAVYVIGAVEIKQRKVKL